MSHFLFTDERAERVLLRSGDWVPIDRALEALSLDHAEDCSLWNEALLRARAIYVETGVPALPMPEHVVRRLDRLARLFPVETQPDVQPQPRKES